MNKTLVCAVVMSGLLTACGSETSSKADLNTEISKVSYGIGANIGARFGDDLPLDVDAFSAGVRDALAGGELQMSEEEIMSTLQEYQQKQLAVRQEEAQAAGSENQAAADAFFAKNASVEGVKTTESGLQYQVLTEAEGAKPGPDDTVEVHYHGTLLDGTVFDSSYQRGETVSFPVGGVIPGWTEALQMMPVGSKWKLFIPPALAYGPGGAGQMIGPNSALIFDVELISIAGEDKE
ncbi:FKBP-type peptidyl-prolyl cis-trans isomerase [Zhongshania aquimaris]|uniref:Peptidyl-prolyl cis-trans isomerase n=1 Tax=Zhongshania aquimaris TaxID=2857107 RepID=A0ABS6VUB0_9GAMM|nr:FKBP-type peptidyl-prolyl cis-trans isomerase [Zhongshania aquimaris]MBW2941291.1 FKBP-type peptidyl-prolyl cis-trans isomerase [Zhongshania aquimaris]